MPGTLAKRVLYAVMPNKVSCFLVEHALNRLSKSQQRELGGFGVCHNGFYNSISILNVNEL